MCRITILLIPWLYLALTTNAQQSTSNEEVASALRVLLNANEYLKGGRLYNEFIRRQQALQDALRSSLSSPPTMPFVNVFEPVRNQLFNVLPQVSGGFLDRVSNGFNALVQPLPDGTLGTGGLLSGKEKRKEHFKENITELAKAAIKKVTKKIEPDRPREIPNVGGFGAEIRSINAVERVKNGSEDLSESSGNTEAPQLTRITLDDMEMRASDDYYDYIEHENSTPQSQFNDESAERTANATEFDGRQRDSAVRTADLPVSSIKNVDSSDAIISVADNSRTITRRAPRAQKTFGDEVDTDLYETAPMRPHYTLKENETIRQHKKPSHLHKKKTLPVPSSSVADDIEELIKEMNMTEQQAEAFVIIVEKILEEELEKRIPRGRRRLGTVNVVDVDWPSKAAGIETREHHSDSQKEKVRFYYSIDDLGEKEQENEITANEDLRELLTSDKHIKFEQSADGEDMLKSPSQIVNPKRETRARQRKLPLSVSSRGSHGNVPNYRQIEQAEYDRFISGYQNGQSTDVALAVGNEEAVSERTTMSSAALVQRSTPHHGRTVEGSRSVVEPYYSSSNVENGHRGLSPLQIHRISATTMKRHSNSGPRTAFERQVRDFRERLWGSNGFGDIIRALQHASIAFYEQPTYNRYRQS